MTNYVENIDQMLSVWNTDDAPERKAVVDCVLEHNVHFVDPPYNIIGRQAFLEMVKETRLANPGLVYARSSTVDYQNNFCRYDWQITKGGNVVMTGLDVVEINDAGKISKVIGFFGKTKSLQKLSDSTHVVCAV